MAFFSLWPWQTNSISSSSPSSSFSSSPPAADATVDRPELLPKHTIFLSHSGKQKDFVEQLCVDLEKDGYQPFLDKRPESLPKGQQFPDLIFKAARQCRIAVVVLSEDFLMSKWPMKELAAFLEAQKSRKEHNKPELLILPVFLKLSMQSLKDFKRWRKRWEQYKQDPKVLDEWQAALEELDHINALLFEKFDGEVSFREAICQTISQIIPPNTLPDLSHVQGRERLCEEILKMFESTDVYRHTNKKVIGIHGDRGRGKSTLCICLCDCLYGRFTGRVCHAEFESTQSIIDMQRRVLRRLTKANNDFLNSHVTTKEEGHSVMRYRIRDQPVFLALDNMPNDKNFIEEVQKLLRMQFHPGSMMLVTAPSLEVLTRCLDIPPSHCVAAPNLTKEEARQIVLNFWGHAKRPEVTEHQIEILNSLVDDCRFQDGGVSYFHPPTLKELAAKLGSNPSDWKPNECLRTQLRQSISNKATMMAGSASAGMFQGYDRVSGNRLGTAVSGNSETISSPSSAVRYVVCSGILDLSEALELDQSLAVSFFSENMDEKLKFINNQKLSTYNICIVIRAMNQIVKETMTNVVLKPGIQSPKDGNITAVKDFFKAYGDSFVSSRTTGGEYYAVCMYHSETLEQQSNLRAEMNQKGISLNGIVDASLQLKLSSLNSSQKVRISWDQRVSGIAKPKLPAQENIIDFALDFPSLSLTAPALIHFKTTGYEHIPGIGKSFNAISCNRDLIVGVDEDQRTIMLMCRLQQLQNDMSTIMDIYSFYGGYDKDAKIMRVKMKADEDVKAIQKMIEAYATDPTQPLLTLVLHSLGYGNPSLQFVIGKSPAFGGPLGSAFNDVDSSFYFQQHTRISALELRTGEVVDILTVTYSNIDTSWKVHHGTHDHEAAHETWLFPELPVWPGVFVTSISGFYKCISSLVRAPVLTKISIVLSDNQSLTGGRDHRDPGTAFNWRVPDGCFALGFSGHCGWYLDQLQIVYGSFCPALWTT